MTAEAERQGQTPPLCLRRHQVLAKPSDSLLPELCEDKTLLETHGWQHITVLVMGPSGQSSQDDRL